jgi:hypothetical protein
MQVTKGLVIADPWIGYILDGNVGDAIRRNVGSRSICPYSRLAIGCWSRKRDTIDIGLA